MKIVIFWVVSFFVIIWNTFRKRHWNMAYFDFDFGYDKNGRIKRKQLISRRTCNGMELFWQDFSRYKESGPLN